MRNPKLTILFTPDELKVLEELEAYYKLQTSDIVKAALAYVNKKKPPLQNIDNCMNEQMDTATTIFTKIMNYKVRYGNRRSNIFVRNEDKEAISFICRSFSYGESAVIRVSSSRWKIIQGIQKDTDFRIQIMLAYRAWEKTNYHLVLFNLNEISTAWFREGKNGEVYFYTRRIDPEYFEETKLRLGERYHQILTILDQNMEGDM